jgi:hypothetical protein
MSTLEMLAYFHVFLAGMAVGVLIMGFTFSGLVFAWWDQINARRL